MIEAGLWSGLALLGAPAAAWARARWVALARLAPLAPWLDGLLLPFAALMRGAITPREFGLSGFDLTDWLSGSLIVAGLVAGGALVLRGRTQGWERLDPIDSVLDEGRWGLYRASGIAGSGFLLVGAAIGLGLSIVEAGLRSGRMSSPMAFARQQPLALLRPAASFIFFVLTRNAWLTAIGQAALIVAVSRTNRVQGGPEETALPSNRS